jgi:phosphate-selective porin OprO/OprP
MRKSLAAFLFSIAIATGAPFVVAQEGTEEAAAPAESLEARVARLERENQELKATVMRRLPEAAPAENENKYYPVDAANNSASSVLNSELRSTIESILAEQKADEAKKAEDAGIEVGKDSSMTANWKNGVEISSKDKAFRLHVGGRYQFDGSAFSVDRSIQTVEIPGVGAPNHINTPYTDGVDFRRARFRMDGTMYENIDFEAEYDFVNSNNYFTSLTPTNTGATPGTVGIFPQNPLPTNVTALTDLHWTFTKLPTIGNIRVGNHKEAIGFEHMVSSRYLPFMERSYNQDTFYGGTFNGFTPGISMFNTMMGERGTWNIGVFKPPINVFSYNNISSDYSVTGRVTALPWYVDEGRGLFHLGFSVSDRTGYNGVYRYRTRDAIRSGISSTWPVPADTGNILISRQQWLNSECVAVYGPWTWQSEYLVDFSENVRTVNNTTGIAGPNHGTAVYHGGYMQLLCFLTGENDNYNRKVGAFNRVIPTENFFLMPGECGNAFGMGAWQVGARYDYLNLNSAGINGGILNNFTAGLNWFLNPNMKLQFNYMATYRISDASVNVPVNRGGTGWINGWGMRVAQDF